MALGDLFSGITGLFSGSQNTNGRTTSEGTSAGTSTAAGATANTSTPYLQWLASQTANGALGTALSGNTAGNALIGQSAGITPQQIASFANPNAQAQIAATFDPNGTLARTQAAGLSSLKGAASANPYASSTTGAIKDYEAQVAANNANTAAGITTAAWAPATQAALGSQGLTQSAGTGLNTQLAQALGQVPGLIGSAGQSNVGNTAQSGQTSGTTSNVGTNNSTVTNTPSAASALGTVAGIAADVLPFLADGGSVGRRPFAAGGSVDGSDAGGGVDGFHGKVREAFHTFHKLRKEAEHGHKRQGFGDGGWATSLSAGDPGGWGADVTPDTSADDSIINQANYNQGRFDAQGPGMTMADRARGILGAFGKAGMQSSAAAPKTDTTKPADPRNPIIDPSNPSLAALSGIMGSVGETLRPRAADGGRQGYADGDIVTPDGPGGWLGNLARSLTPNSPFAPADSPAATRLRDDYGVDQRAMYSPSRNLVSDLASIDPMVPGHSGPLTGISARMANENAAAFKGADVLHNDAALRGEFASGKPTLAGIAQPYDLYHKWAVASAADPDMAARQMGLLDRMSRNDMPTEEEIRRAYTPPVPRPTFPSVTPSSEPVRPAAQPMSPAVNAAKAAPPAIPAGGTEFIEGLKQREGGFKPQPFSDGSRKSIGYGTQAQAGDERGITEEDAARRMQVAEAEARKGVKNWASANGVPLSQPQEDAMTDITYRGGPAWQRGPLGAALKQGNLDEAQRQYEGYNVNVRDPRTGVLAPSQGVINRNQQMAPLLKAGAEPAQTSAQPASVAGQAADLVQQGVLNEPDATLAASRYFQLRQNPEVGAAIKGVIDKSGVKIPEGDWRAEARTFVQAAHANPQGVPNRTYPSGSVPLGGDPSAANSIAPYAPDARKTTRPTMSDEDRRNMLIRQVSKRLGMSLEHTPGYMYEQEQAKLRAKRDVDIEDKQKSGRKVEDAFDKMHDALVEAGPDVVNAATGPYLGDPNSPWRDRLSLLPSEVRKKAQSLGVEMDHFVDRVANAQGGGDKAATDQARTEMKNIVGHAFKSTSLEGVFKVLHDAKNASQDKLELPADPVQKSYMPHQWLPESERIAPPKDFPQARLGNDNLWYAKTREGRWLPVGKYTPPEGLQPQTLRAQPSNAPDQVTPPARKLGMSELEDKALGDVVKIGGVPHELTSQGWVSRPETPQRSQEENLRRAGMTPIERAAENRASAAEARTAAPAHAAQSSAETQAAFARDAASMDPLALAQRYDGVRNLLTPDQLRLLNAAIDRAVPMPGRR